MAVKMVTVCFSETTVFTYDATRRYNPGAAGAIYFQFI
jgi:hypothetical protein